MDSVTKIRRFKDSAHARRHLCKWPPAKKICQLRVINVDASLFYVIIMQYHRRDSNINGRWRDESLIWLLLSKLTRLQEKYAVYLQRGDVIQVDCVAKHGLKMYFLFTQWGASCSLQGELLHNMSNFKCLWLAISYHKI